MTTCPKCGQTKKMDTKSSLEVAREYVAALKRVARIGAELQTLGRYAPGEFLKNVENEECYVSDMYGTANHVRK
jgi:hypothetical protein